jgi:hypothetical protein
MISLLALDSIMASTRKIDNVESAIYPIRGQRVVLDSDLAAIYGVTTFRLNEQLRRNLKRFPDDFAFQLTHEEFTRLRSQFAISKRGRGGRRFCRTWCAHVLASVLNSEVAVQASVRVVRAFVRLCQMVAANAQLAAKLEELERRLDSHGEAIVDLFVALKRSLEPPEPRKKREIGFHVRERSCPYKVKKRI